MKTLLPESSDENILNAVQAWVDLLAQEDYRSAFDYLHHPAVEHWTPDLIEEAIYEYKCADNNDTCRSVVTPLTEASGDSRPTHEVMRYAADNISVRFDLPINGKWSDLTAILDVVMLDGTLALELKDIHVM